mgnify:CR=1 FL=1
MNGQNPKSGAVLVIGAGISGMQSALDLANAGFKVYLVEESPSIGGVMPQLDKTFPTNDCAMCILAPRLVDTGRHPNIQIICNSEITGLEGEAGNFTAEITTRSTFVDPDVCNGCGDCVEVCPVSIPSGFDEKIGRRKAIDRPFPQAIPNVFNIDKDGVSPCKDGCPARANVHGYIALAAQQKWAEAFHLIRERIPFPGVLGRICHHPCEEACNRCGLDEPVAIRDIKRFVADYFYDHPELEEEYRRVREARERKNQEEGASYVDPFAVDKERGKDRQVAIIGAGPAGLTCAAGLSKRGYRVEIFEEENKAGGMMHQVIPDFRLNKDYLQKEVEFIIRDHDLKVHYGKSFGKDFSLSDLKKKGFEAVFLAIGARLSKGMKLQGEEAEGVYPGLDFIRSVNREEFAKGSLKGKKVAVLGGGNVAMDAARMSLRLGADVAIVYRRSRKQMPATEEEIRMAEEEGIKFEMLTNPVKFNVENGKLSGMRCIRMRLGEPDDSGRRRPVPIEGSEFDFPCDMAIQAIGQKVQTKPLESEKLDLKWDLLISDEVTFQTSIPHVFAGGDVVTGPASVVEAIRAGHEAAVSIDRFLHNEDLAEGRTDEPELADTPERERYEKTPRAEMPKRPAPERIYNFNEVTLTMSKEDVIREAKRCLDCGLCSECMECVAACGCGAVDHNMNERKRTVRVGAVIVSPGYEKFVPETTGSLGFDLYPNVVTSIQFERMLSASGPYNGHPVRPSDHEAPKKIAWLQCVGSRDESCDRPWCSSVCCMYATKEAVIAKEHLPGIETHIYYMDIRSFGKDFERYINRAKDEYGVVYRQTRVPRVQQNPVTKNLKVRYVENGEVLEEEYDMVVLSVGMQPCEHLGDLSKLLQLQLNEYGFIRTDEYQKTRTGRPGIYAAGAVIEPKDIPESVTEASGAASEAASGLAESRGSEITVKTYPEERIIDDEEPRVGVFICHCGTNIAGVVDVPEVVEQTRSLPGVVFADDVLYACSQDTQETIKQKIEQQGINRVVIASCTPRTHEPLFADTIREVGLNPFLVEMANIRDQCSWVHRDNPDLATEKAVELVKMTVNKAARLYPVQQQEVPLIQKALVLGGGIAGMTAALSVADQGFDVTLVEKEGKLGGRLNDIRLGFQKQNPGTLLEETIKNVNENEKIDVMLSSELEDIGGYVGNFKSTIRIPDGSKEIEHGVIIVATGADEYKPTEYLYGESDKVILQKDLEEQIAGNDIPADLREVVMIQCVGSRDDDHPWCSRVCCSQALKNALALKEKSPETNIYVLYRDIRTYGFREDYLYRRAREKGIVFIRYEEEKPPEVSKKNGKIEVRIKDHVLNRMLTLHPDRLVLSAGMVPAFNEPTARLLKVPLTQDGFFSEAHAKLRPVDFAADGIYLCGTAHSPRFVEESITQARAAAARALQILSKETLRTKGIVVTVNPRKCIACEVCVGVCSYDAREFDPVKGYVTVNEVLCQGCGACAVACPNGATQQNRFTRKQIYGMLEALLT